MKLYSICLAILLIACTRSTTGEAADQPLSKKTEQGLVYYYAFEIERITGLHESEIEQYGSRYCITRDDFKQSLLTAPERVKNLQYDKLDVRAKLVFSDKQYLIDRMGVVRGGQEYVLLDKEKFVSHLKSIGKC